MPSPRNEYLKSLPLRSLHVGFSARFGQFSGWEMPLWYRGVIDEVRAVRQAVGIFDISHMGRFKITGDRAAASLSSAFSRDLTGLPSHGSTYSLACNEGGGILDDLIIYHLAQEFLVVCNAANIEVIRNVLHGVSENSAVVDLQPDTTLLAVQGPLAVNLIAELLSEAVLDLKPRECAQIEVGETKYFVTRTGYTGEDGLEVMTSVAAGDALLQANVGAGAVLCGLAARDILRLEASLPLYGLDIDESTTPWEAGLGWAVDLGHQFTGREALKLLRGSEKRRLSCLLGDTPGIARSRQPVWRGNTRITETTSGGFSPTLSRSVAMAYLPNELTELGTELEIDARGRRVHCRVVKRPFFESQYRRQRFSKGGTT